MKQKKTKIRGGKNNMPYPFSIVWSKGVGMRRMSMINGLITTIINRQFSKVDARMTIF